MNPEDFYKLPVEVRRRVIKQTHANFIEMASQRDRKFDQLTRRIYDLPGCAGSYRALLAIIASGLLDIDDTSTHNVSNAAMISAMDNHPWWYITKPVLELVQNIEHSTDLHVDEMSFKSPSMWFILPVGVLKGDRGEDIHWLNVTFVNQEIRERAAAYHKWPAPPPMRQPMVLQCSAWSNDGTLFHTSVPFSDGRINVEEAAKLPFQADLAGDTRWGSTVLMPLCVNIVTLMAAKPELVEIASTHQRTIKSTGKETWTARVLGRNYRRYVPPTDGDRSVSPHLRRAHWKRVRHGPGRTLVKQMLIDETWVGVITEE